jgi:hypothetical protein
MDRFTLVKTVKILKYIDEKCGTEWEGNLHSLGRTRCTSRHHSSSAFPKAATGTRRRWNGLFRAMDGWIEASASSERGCKRQPKREDGSDVSMRRNGVGLTRGCRTLFWAAPTVGIHLKRLVWPYYQCGAPIGLFWGALGVPREDVLKLDCWSTPSFLYIRPISILCQNFD